MLFTVFSLTYMIAIMRPILQKEGTIDVILLLLFTGGACAAGLFAFIRVFSRWRRAVSVGVVELSSVPMVV